MNDWIGPIVLGVGSALIAAVPAAYALFKWLGKEWLHNHFAKELEQFRHEKAKELESVRHAVQATHSRITKIHEREFDVLPKMWLMLHQLHGLANHAVGNTMISTVAWDRMTPDVMRKELNRVGFNAAQIEAVSFQPTEEAKNRTYVDALLWNYLDDAHRKQRELMNYVIEHRIFLTPELDKRITEVCKEIGVALTIYGNGKHAGDWERQHKQVESIISQDAKLPEIASLIQTRLCYDAAGLRMPAE